MTKYADDTYLVVAVGVITQKGFNPVVDVIQYFEVEVLVER
jgi:hypothetical protein